LISEGCDLCLPGDLGCWGGEEYADYMVYVNTHVLKYPADHFRSPDYFVLQFSMGAEFIPLVGRFININGQVVLDTYGNVYFGVGAGLGESAISGYSYNGSAGWLLTEIRPQEAALQSFIGQHTINGNVGVVGGIGITHGDPNLEEAFEIGYYTPQIGGSYTYGYLIYDANSATPWPWQR
jgi:hypothetical protein